MLMIARMLMVMPGQFLLDVSAFMLTLMLIYLFFYYFIYYYQKFLNILKLLRGILSRLMNRVVMIMARYAFLKRPENVSGLKSSVLC